MYNGTCVPGKYHNREAALTAWRPRPFLRTISLAGALIVNSARVPRFVSSILGAEIHGVFNKVFKSVCVFQC